MKKFNKKGISPLVATVLLVAFAVSLGAVVMSWAKGVEAAPSTDEGDIGSSDCLVKTLPSDPLKALQAKYIVGQISKEEFFQQAEQFK